MLTTLLSTTEAGGFGIWHGLAFLILLLSTVYPSAARSASTGWRVIGVAWALFAIGLVATWYGYARFAAVSPAADPFATQYGSRCWNRVRSCWL